MSEEHAMNRRKALGSIGAVLATVAVTPVLAKGETPSLLVPKALEDPTKKYPKPPFKRQLQPWPGLAGKMDPRPDHGETSYKGSGRLNG